MPSLASSGKPSAVSKGNLLAGGLVFFMVAGFFFLPELISVNPQDNPTATYEEQPPTYEVAEQQAQVAQLQVEGEPQQVVAMERDQEVLHSEQFVAQAGDSPLANVSYNLESQPREAVQGEKESSLPDGGLANCPSPNQLAACQAIAHQKEDTFILPSGPGTTWDALLAPKIRVPLDKSANSSLKIAKAIPATYVRTKYALLDYVKGIETIRGKGLGVIPASDAVEYLHHLDAVVTLRMQEERVPREFLLRWNESSLKEPFVTSLSVQQKKQMINNFQPHITLSKVVVRRKGENYHADRSQPAIVNVRGYVKGGDTAKLSYYYNSDDFKPSGLTLQKPDKFGRRMFRLTHIKVFEGDTLTFRATDIKENVFDKKYRFLPNASRFQWTEAPHIGHYQISMKEFDPRYDSLFRSGKGRLVSGPSHTKAALSTSSTRF